MPGRSAACCWPPPSADPTRRLPRWWTSSPSLRKTRRQKGATSNGRTAAAAAHCAAMDIASSSSSHANSPGPLAGLKVLELGQLIAGPFAGKTLADFGADVIKIEAPGAGDPLRKWRLLKDGTSVWWEVQSRNKRSVVLDLREPGDQSVVRSLAAEA